MKIISTKLNSEARKANSSTNCNSDFDIQLEKRELKINYVLINRTIL